MSFAREGARARDSLVVDDATLFIEIDGICFVIVQSAFSSVPVRKVKRARGDVPRGRAIRAAMSAFSVFSRSLMPFPSVTIIFLLASALLTLATRAIFDFFVWAVEESAEPVIYDVCGRVSASKGVKREAGRTIGQTTFSSRPRGSLFQQFPLHDNLAIDYQMRNGQARRLTVSVWEKKVRWK